MHPIVYKGPQSGAKIKGSNNHLNHIPFSSFLKRVKRYHYSQIMHMKGYTRTKPKVSYPQYFTPDEDINKLQ